MASTSSGVGPPLVDPNDRTLPGWMDPEGEHGTVVVLQMKMAEEGELLPKNPFIIAKTIQQQVGRIASAQVENRGLSMALKVRSWKQAEKLKNVKELFDKSKVVVTEHPTRNQTRVVVSCSQTIGMTEDELKEELKDQGITNVRKFTKIVNGTKTDTASMVLTIKGTVLPTHIYFGFQRCEARPYIPSPMLCYNCFEYGHSKGKCGKGTACQNCSMTHPAEKDSEGRPSPCSKPAFCKNCQGNHNPSNKKCPRYVEEAEIAKVRAERNITFGEAKQIVANRTSTSATSFSATVSRNFTPIDPNQRTQESETIQKLRKELEEARKAITELAQAKQELVELAEARKAAQEVEQLRKEIAELRHAQRKQKQTGNNPNGNEKFKQPNSNKTKNQNQHQKQQKNKDQEATNSSNDESQPEAKKKKNQNQQTENIDDTEDMEVTPTIYVHGKKIELDTELKIKKVDTEPKIKKVRNSRSVNRTDSNDSPINRTDSKERSRSPHKLIDLD